MHRMSLQKFRDFYQTYLQQNLDSISEPYRDYLKRYNISRADDIYGHAGLRKRLKSKRKQS